MPSKAGTAKPRTTTSGTKSADKTTTSTTAASSKTAKPRATGAVSAAKATKTTKTNQNATNTGMGTGMSSGDTGQMSTGEDRYRMIQDAAYHIAERDGFQPGKDVDYWLQAEREFESRQSTHEVRH